MRRGLLPEVGSSRREPGPIPSWYARNENPHSREPYRRPPWPCWVPGEVVNPGGSGVTLTSRGREALGAYTQALRDLLGGL